MDPRDSEKEDNSKFSAVGIDLCEAINFVTTDDWWNEFEHLELKGVLSERGTLLGGVPKSPVLHITADPDYSVQDPEVRTGSSEEEEISLLSLL